MSRIISLALLHFLYEKTARVNKHMTQKLWDLPKNLSWSHGVCQPEHIYVLLWLDREWINPRTVWVQHCSSAPWVWEGIFLVGASHLLQMQSQRLVTKNQSNSSSEPSAGWCLCRGGCAAECFVLCWERLPTHRQANSKGKAQGNQCCASKGGRGSSGERKLLADFQYHRVIQVSCFTCGFWPIVEGLFKIAALLFSSPPFFHPMLSRLSTQRNHYARVAQGRVTQPTHPFQVQGENRGVASEIHTFVYSGADCRYLCSGVLCVCAPCGLHPISMFLKGDKR